MHGWARTLVLVLCACSAPAQAHHSLTGYDHARQVAIEGVVSAFEFSNPHPFLTIEVAAASGKQAWRLEMDNLFELRAVGVSRDTFKRGDRVLVSGSASRDGARGMYLRRLDRPSDGLRYEQAGRSPTLSVRPKS